MNTAEKFEYLMNIIEHWVEDEPEKNSGPFRHLSNEIYLREVCVTPGCSVSIAQLKTFFATAVLEIYPWNSRSKVSYRDIQRFLSGELNTKKYSFFFEKLEKCFSAEENREAAKKTRIGRAVYMLMRDMEEGELLFFYLLERLQTMVRITVGEYWRMCDPNQESLKKKGDRRIRWKQKNWQAYCEEDDQLLEKQNKYMECFMTIALHEIFVRECERQCGVLQEASQARKESLKNVEEKLSEIIELAADADKKDIRAWTESTAGNVQEMKEYTKWLSRYLVLLTIYVEHVIGVETELLLIMILEAKNLGILKGDVSFGQQVAMNLKCIKDKNTESFMQYNKNRAKYYRQLESDVEEIYLRFMQKITEKGRQNFSEAMQTYLTIVETGKFDEGNCKSLWTAQCILVMPMR